MSKIDFPSQTPQEHNLSELMVALSGLKHPDGSPYLTGELKQLMDSGLHHTFLPATLSDIKAAEMFHLTAQALGGLPAMILFAQKNPATFWKLYARQTAPTINPVVPPATTTVAANDWPEWLTQRRLAYQESHADTDAQDSNEDANGSD